MGKGKRIGCLNFILIAAVCVAAYLTNPGVEKHQAAAKEKLNTIAGNMLENYGINAGLLSLLGIDSDAGFVDELIRDHISCGNYYLFSTTRVNWDDQSQVIGIGAFGHVYISGKVEEIMQRELENYVKQKIRDIKIPGLNLEDFKLEEDL